jgi:peptidoglycan L-alanyl-D-glutamate endopeptidase CwlK
MINSRDIKELLPVVRAKVERFQQLCEENGIDLLITSTFRDAASQAALYAQGRTAPGAIVTNAKPGQSWHNHRCAIDVVPLVNGKANWNTKDPVWAKLGELGKQAGLEWAGEWKRFKEMAHFQYTGGFTLAQLQAGVEIV